MTRSSSLDERPVLRLLLLALMGLALASRLALGATVPDVGGRAGATAADPLGKLQAAMIMCHTGPGHVPLPKSPRAPVLSDLLLFAQGDNVHALASDPVPAPVLVSRWFAIELPRIRAAPGPQLRRATSQARAPPAAA